MDTTRRGVLGWFLFVPIGLSPLLAFLASCAERGKSKPRGAAAVRVPVGTSVAAATEAALGAQNVGYDTRNPREIIRLLGRGSTKDPSGYNPAVDQGFRVYVDGRLHLSAAQAVKLTAGTHTISWVFVDAGDDEKGEVVRIAVEAA